jgi:hypothetical protein
MPFPSPPGSRAQARRSFRPLGRHHSRRRAATLRRRSPKATSTPCLASAGRHPPWPSGRHDPARAHDRQTAALLLGETCERTVPGRRRPDRRDRALLRRTGSVGNSSSYTRMVPAHHMVELDQIASDRTAVSPILHAADRPGAPDRRSGKAISRPSSKRSGSSTACRGLAGRSLSRAGPTRRRSPGPFSARAPRRRRDAGFFTLSSGPPPTVRARRLWRGPSESARNGGPWKRRSRRFRSRRPFA